MPPRSVETFRASSVAVGKYPREITAADFNLDGRLDVAVANSGDNSVSVLLGTDDAASLAPLPPLPAGREPSDLSAIDIDLDGDPDLAVANHETPYVSVLLNDGHANFMEAPYSPLDTGAIPHVHGLVTGDFNADSWPDIAVESADSRQVRILHGSQSGFSAPIPVPVPSMPYFRLGLLLEPDEMSRILVPGHDDRTVHLVQLAGEAYETQLLFSLDGQPWAVEAADINGDGAIDIIVIQTDAVSLWLGSDGPYTAEVESPHSVVGATGVAVGDVNQDGARDVLIGPWDGDSISMLMGGSFSSHSLNACQRPIGLAVADITGSPVPEVVATCPLEDRILVLELRSP